MKGSNNPAEAGFEKRPQGALSQEGGDPGYSLLTRAALQYLDLPLEDDIYRQIARQLHVICGGHTVLVNSFDAETGIFHLRYAVGVDLAAASRLTGMQLTALSCQASPEALAGLSTGRVEKVPSLAALACGALTDKQCRVLERAYRFGDIYAMGFYWRERLFGSASILVGQGQELQNRDLIEAFLSITSVALQRRRLEEDLRSEMENAVQVRTEELRKANESLQQEVRGRRKIERDLRESQAKYAAVVEQASDGVVILQDGECKYANRAMETMTGYSEDEIMAMPGAFAFVDENGRARIAKLHKARLEGEETPHVHDVHLRCKDGSRRQVEISSTVIRYGDRPAELNVIRDVTERKRMDEFLRASFYDTTIGTCIVQDGKLQAINSRLEEMIGYTETECMGRNADFFIHPQDRDKAKEQARKNLSNASPVPCEVRYVHKDGSHRWAMATVRAFTYRGKRAVLGNLIDTTELKRAQEARLETEKRYQLLAENVSDVLWVLDIKTLQPIYLSPSVSRMLGFSLEEAMKRNLMESLTPASAEEARRGLAEGFQLESDRKPGRFKSRMVQLEFVRKDGTCVWAEVRVSILHDESGEAYAIVGVARDITQRKQAEDLLSTAFASSPIGMYIVQGGKFVVINPVFERLLGYREGSLIGMDSMGLVHPDDREMVRRNAIRMLKRRRSSPYEFRYLTKSGRVRWVLESVTPIDFKGDKAALGSFMDITERKIAQEALKESEEWFRAIYEESPIGIQLRDASGKLIGLNKACAGIFGLPEESSGKWQPLFSDPSIPDEVKDKARRGETARWRMALDGPVLSAIRGTPAEADTVLYLDTIITPLFLQEGGPLSGYLLQIQDVTEQIRMEEERRQLEDKAHMTSRLASVGMMASGIAHEINNPLTGVVGFTQLLLEKQVPDEIRDDLEVIHEGAQRVASIVKRLLTFARQYKPERRYVNVNDILQTNLDLCAYEMQSNGISVTTLLDGDLPETVADSSQLQQVFLNIMINAEKAMKTAHGKGNLVIQTRTVDGMIHVSFTDDGPGIPKENLTRIFEPFFTTREVGEGTGLGLSICHTIVAEHNGRILVDSELGKGTTFDVEIPIVQGEEEPDSSPVKVVRSGKRPRGRILAVDDETSVLELVRQALAEEGHEIDTAVDARGALALIRHRKYDLIVLDVKLPDMNGTELYKIIKKESRGNGASRVVFITGDVLSEDTKSFLAESKTVHVHKPFDARQIRQEVNRLLGGM